MAELIAGEKRESSAEVSGDERCIIDYSVREINRKVGIARRRYRSGLALAVVIILAAVIFILRQGDYFYIIDRSPSPDGIKTITVYDKALDGSRPSGSAVSLIVDLGNDSQWRIVYGNSEFKGVWWAPDSKKYVLHLEQEGEPQLALAWLERNSESNLSAYLSMGVEMSELSKYGYAIEDGWPNIEYQFLQWAEDSRSMLIYYSFEDADGKNHSGYFWYNCIDCTVSALLETAPQKA